MQKLKNHPYFKIATNKFVVAIIIFAGWMIFLDTNSFFVHKQLNKKLDQLNDDVEFYETELVGMRQELHELESNPTAFEKYAREKFWMHKPGEQIVLIEFREK